MENPFTTDIAGIKTTTRVQVTTETIRSSSLEDGKIGSASESASRSSFSSTHNLSKTGIDNCPEEPKPTHARVPQFSNTANWPYYSRNERAQEAERKQWTVNITAGGSGEDGHTVMMDEETTHGRQVNMNSRTPNPALQANSAAWGYAKVALLMFIAMFIVWVPSTINRVYSLARPNQPKFGLSFVAGFVLPLQGFWNAMIYIATTRRQCIDAFFDVAGRLHSGLGRRRKQQKQTISDFTNRTNGFARSKDPESGDGIIELSRSSVQSPIGHGYKEKKPSFTHDVSEILPPSPPLANNDSSSYLTRADQH
jgi:hypothetical protein